VLDAGTRLRARHHWAVTEAEFDGRRRLLMWALPPEDAEHTPLLGSPEGVRTQLTPLALRLQLGGGPLPPGRYTVHFKLEAGGAAIVKLAGTTVDVAYEGSSLDAEVMHPGGPLTLSLTAVGAADSSLWIGDAKIAIAH
jgi:hypothetical protein